MVVYDIPASYNSLVVCGDIHGEFKTLLYNLKRFQVENAVIVVAGDCGIGFEKPNHYDQLYRKLSVSLEKLNLLLLLIRGNHDDPSYFDGKRLDYPKMKAIPDYSVIRFKEHCTLCIGGAISIDRTLRLEAMWSDKVKGRTVKNQYWENEQASYDEASLSSLKSSNLKIDTVITHTAPSFCYPLAKNGISTWLCMDNTLEADLLYERQQMDKVYKYLKANLHPVESWYYGHFHDSHTEYIENTRFTLLNINELKVIFQTNH